ncbi:MAG: hypothetical protein ACI4OT_05060 [Bacilli bacterium]
MKKIKNILKILIFIILSLFIVKTIIYFNTSIKEKNYKINDFNIYEKYTKNNNYYIEISNKKYKFSFINDFNYHKKMGIVKDIKTAYNKEIYCIYPIFKDNINGEIICNKNGKYYNYYSVKDNELVKRFVKDLGIDHYKDSNKYKEFNNMKIYYNNLVSNTKIIIWNYKGIDIIGEEYNSIKLSDSDIYNNKLGVLVGNKYINPSYDNKFEFNKIIEINLDNMKEKEYDLEKNISFDSYINGVIANDIYIMDKDNLIQYIYDYKQHQIKEVGNKEENGIYFKNNKKEIVNIYDLKNNEMYFENNIELSLKDNYDIKESYKYLNRYYFITSDNLVYMTYKENMDNPVFLFKADDIKEFKVINDYIYFIDEDNLYMYNRYLGLKKIINKNEFKYNYQNIFNVYIKNE